MNKNDRLAPVPGQIWTDAMWLGLPAKEIADKQIFHGDLSGRFAYYRHTFELKSAGNLTPCTTANSRYRLWVNGSPVTSGPCKGDLYRHYYESAGGFSLLHHPGRSGAWQVSRQLSADHLHILPVLHFHAGGNLRPV